ncbi:MAG: hypothetical protein AUK47_25015 [Deltaproteobacteria bacterium CG2_30_63_29]|nr:MAG: hypothetical protein AUK47_25015 [Deltaproteobacteria bacterium CG2_30_63_29]
MRGLIELFLAFHPKTKSKRHQLYRFGMQLKPLLPKLKPITTPHIQRLPSTLVRHAASAKTAWMFYVNQLAALGVMVTVASLV